MQTIIFDGRAAAVKIKEELKNESQIKSLKPGLAVILVGQNPASLSYIKQKQKSCQELGWDFYLYQKEKETKFEEIEELLKNLNTNAKTNGIVLQLPLPSVSQLSPGHLIGLVDSQKEIDGLSPTSQFTPPTAQAVLYVLTESGIATKGKKVVVLGRGKTAGAPIARILKEKGADVFVISSQTPLSLITSHLSLADVVVSCVGKPNLITGEMIKEGAVVIGVGISQLSILNSQFKICGDLDESSLIGKASLITPTPGGIGPLTVAFLLKNLMKACRESGRG